MNHDLKKLIVTATKWTIQNIKYLYKEKLYDENQLKKLDVFITNLLEEIALLEHVISEKPDSIYQEIEPSNTSDKIFDIFDLKFEEENSENEWNSIIEGNPIKRINTLKTDDKEIQLHESITAVFNSEGIFEKVISIGIDISK